MKDRSRSCAGALLLGRRAACAPAVPLPAPPVEVAAPLPEMRTFAPTTPPAHGRTDNARLGRDVLDLLFVLESGRELERFTRFEGTVRVGLRGAVPPTARMDLARLIARLRAEAGIDIVAAARGTVPGIVVEFVPARVMRATVPEAACFVVPGVSDWAAFDADRRSPALDWARLETRATVAVFIPDTAAPQEVRDCLHEEIAQGLGPLNDLWRLTDSVFNDDNFHTVLTGFDMLVLRVVHDPALQSGMSRAEVAERLPRILERINPAGGRVAPTPGTARPSRAWAARIEAAITPGAGRATRAAAARGALILAEREGAEPAERALSHFLVARSISLADPAAALDHYAAARAIWARLPGTAPHLAQLDMDTAVIALRAGRPEAARGMIARALPAAAAAENAALLSTMLMIDAVAADASGDARGARARWLDSLGWARYGFGADDKVRARAGSIAALSPSRS
jgi:hypothetical protein